MALSFLHQIAETVVEQIRCQMVRFIAQVQRSGCQDHEANRTIAKGTGLGPSRPKQLKIKVISYKLMCSWIWQSLNHIFWIINFI